jgi:hypothetical protein
MGRGHGSEYTLAAESRGLEGVNPKVIVLLAGTNNVGNDAPAADVTRGLEGRRCGI